MNSIDYSFPQKFVPTTVNLDLHIDIPNHTTTTTSTTITIQQPIFKQFTTKTFQDPLNDILKLSRQKIQNYQLSLPSYEEEEEEEEGETHKDDDDDDDEVKSELENNKENDIVGDSKTIDINQSTPIKKLPQLPPQLPQQLPSVPLRNKKSDNLACHADNILRMAIDSTIISSNSFTINSFEEEEEDDDDDFLQENSLIQLLKYKNSKRDLRFKPPIIKFDINADDINSVL
ncbi:conserved hypothetical protein [Candida dubliniensis CD36]|uniref:Uncharacterized protein n=1 Tax=Candida dubliniensis (strain CD36 / ATCC MYA-646 / CBS 7987 / NCPF 3949 / NRRL Y-17841) TaxID=573826 RepID=B9WD79_CANDC|nr:conserved hypothetical protein [Candida dubliniensis CD36]CAX42629.1 conserved hypothetical protein [Candida dubliniensis CD36]